MSSLVTVYRWDDVGAPQLDGTSGAFINVLKKCLVDGYGSKSPLGWSLEFDNPSIGKAVFKNSPVTGSGGFFQIWSSTGLPNSVNTYFNIKAAVGMTDFDTYVNPSYQAIMYNNSFNTRWVIVGTDRGFYIQALDNRYTDYTYYYSNVWFVGDIKSYIPNDAGQFLLLGGELNYDDTSASETDSITWISQNRILNKVYDVDGNPGNTIYKLPFVLNVSTTPQTNTLDVTTPVMMQKCIMALVSSDKDRDNISVTISETRPQIRGELVGFIKSNLVCRPTVSWPMIVPIDGVDHIGFAHKYGVECWINTEVWYD
jgi:hypothetical protein